MSWFLCTVWGKGPISFFCVLMSGFPNTVSEETLLSLFCISGALIGMGLLAWALCSEHLPFNWPPALKEEISSFSWKGHDLGHRSALYMHFRMAIIHHREAPSGHRHGGLLWVSLAHPYPLGFPHLHYLLGPRRQKSGGKKNGDTERLGHKEIRGKVSPKEQQQWSHVTVIVTERAYIKTYLETTGRVLILF